MNKKITVRGIGHMFEIFVLPPGIIFIILGFIFKPLFSFRMPYIILLISGIIFLIAGLALNFISMIKIIPAFKEGKLLTEGAFKFSRNPTYASLIFFTIPSLSFLFDTFTLLLCTIIVFIIFKICIKREETFLEVKFGDEFRMYKKNTGQLFPKIFKKKTNTNSL